MKISWLRSDLHLLHFSTRCALSILNWAMELHLQDGMGPFVRQDPVFQASFPSGPTLWLETFASVAGTVETVETVDSGHFQQSLRRFPEVLRMWDWENLMRLTGHFLGKTAYPEEKARGGPRKVQKSGCQIAADSQLKAKPTILTADVITMNFFIKIYFFFFFNFKNLIKFFYFLFIFFLIFY